MRFVYATRRSKLALAQSRAFVASLAAFWPEAEFEELQVVTMGDRIQDRPLTEIGGKGLFVKEIEEAMLDGRADFAVHSIKDVPAELPPGLWLSCIPPRESASDALIAPRHGSLAALPQGANVGTGSLRRSLSLLRARPDLHIVPLRGNVDTRLGKVDAGEHDAIVLAEAGLVRLGLQARITERLAHAVSLPAVGQGALGIESRQDDAKVAALLEKVHHTPTSRAVLMERGVLRALGADCKTPFAAYAEPDASGSTRLRAWVSEPDGSQLRVLERNLATPDDDAAATAAGQAFGAELLAARS